MSKDPHPLASGLCDSWRARAHQSGIWLAREGDGTLCSTRDFSRALACPTKERAAALWEELCAQERARPKPPAWASKPPALFRGMSAESAPEGLTLFMALCQNRFVCQKQGYNSSVDWGLSSDPAEAHVFTSSGAAADAARSVMPKTAENPTVAVLPLRARFGAPERVDDFPADPMAGALAAASARGELEGGLGPDAGPSSAAGKARRRAL